MSPTIHGWIKSGWINTAKAYSCTLPHLTVHWRLFGILLCIAAALLLVMTANNDQLLSEWECLLHSNEWKWLASMLCGEELRFVMCEACCHDRHQTVICTFLWQRGSERCVWREVAGYPCGFNYCSIVARLSQQRRPGFDVGLIPHDSWMLGWSGLLMQTSHCYPYFLSGMAVWLKAAVCVCVCLACSVSLWMAVCVCVWERDSNRERSHLVSWKFRGNEHNVLECKCLWKSKLHARKVRLGCLKGWYEKTWEDRQQLSAEIVQRKGRWADTLSATLNDPGLILTRTIILLWAFIFLMQICSYCL